MKLTVTPGSPLRGTVSLPGDKSLSHRAALFAALAEGESRIGNFLVSGVTRAMLAALTALEVPWQLEHDMLWVQGLGLEALRRSFAGGSPVHLDCGNSATTLRLLAGALAAAGVPAVLDGSPGLRRRPMDRIVAPLQAMGVRIRATEGCAPVILEPGEFPLKELTYTLPVASAQVKSCLLLAALAAGGPTTLIEPGPSRDHTERMLRSMGIAVEQQNVAVDPPPAPGGRPAGEVHYITRLTPVQPLALVPLRLALPGDFSSAAFLIVAALITPGSEITIRGVGLNPTRTGLLEALVGMGAEIAVQPQPAPHDEPVGDLVVRHSALRGRRVSGELVVRMIDEFPAFACAAAFAQGRVEVCDAEELRHKESDRIAALCLQLRRLGVEAGETPDGFIINGRGQAGGGAVDPCGDHRLAMALAAVGLAAQAPIAVQNAEIFSESFPGYVDVLQGIGARIEAQAG